MSATPMNLQRGICQFGLNARQGGGHYIHHRIKLPDKARMEKGMATYFLRMPRKVRSLDESSGCFSTAAAGVAIIGASVKCVESAEGTGEGFLTEDPEDEEAMQCSLKDAAEIFQGEEAPTMETKYCHSSLCFCSHRRQTETREAPLLKPKHDDCA